MPTPYLKALVVNVQIGTETLYLCVCCCKDGMQMIAFSAGSVLLFLSIPCGKPGNVLCITHHIREYLTQYFRTRLILSKRQGDNSKTFL